mmetsp:Transcript_16169/g.48460  ORF Transcript_16169/g.48460 Transcript_16169/m.48460 type:complete len:233 (-) Transcript_16169:506-1204(-)
MQPPHRLPQQQLHLIPWRIDVEVHEVSNVQGRSFPPEPSHTGLVLRIAAAAYQLQPCRQHCSACHRFPRVCTSYLACPCKGAQLQAVILLWSKLGEGDEVETLELALQGELCQLGSVTGGVHHRRQPPCPEQLRHVVRRPAAVRHHRIGTAASSAVCGGEAVIVYKLHRRQQPVLSHLLPVIIPRRPAAHLYEHVGRDGGVVRVRNHTTPRCPGQRICECPACRIQEHLGAQ